MSPAVWLIIGAALIVALVVMFGPRLAQLYAENRAISRCNAIRAELERERSLGTNMARVAELQTQLTACTQEVQRYGADASLAEVTLAGCDAIAAGIEQQFNHLKSTDYADVLKRGNTFNAMMGMGEDLTACFEQTLAEAGSEESLIGPATAKALYTKIRGALVVALAQSEARARCYRAGAGGCDRYLGSVEGDGQTKGTREETTIRDPLRVLIADTDARIGRIDAELRVEAQNAQNAEQQERRANIAAIASGNLVSSGLIGGGLVLMPN